MICATDGTLRFSFGRETDIVLMGTFGLIVWWAEVKYSIEEKPGEQKAKCGLPLACILVVRGLRPSL
jgi:hypothetical protein